MKKEVDPLDELIVKRKPFVCKHQSGWNWEPIIVTFRSDSVASFGNSFRRMPTIFRIKLKCNHSNLGCKATRTVELYIDLPNGGLK